MTILDYRGKPFMWPPYTELPERMLRWSLNELLQPSKLQSLVSKLVDQYGRPFLSNDTKNITIKFRRYSIEE